MAYKRFRITVFIRIILLTLFISLFFYLLFKTQFFAALFITTALIFYQIYSLIHYVEITNRDLTRFFESIKYGDFTQTFKDDQLGSSFASLRNTFTEVSNAFRRTRAEKEEHYRYLQTVVQHVGIGLLAFQSDGEVELINTSFKKLMGIPHLKNIKSLESISSKLVDTLFNLKPRTKALVKVDKDNELLHLVLNSTEFKLRSQTFSLVSIQNIHSEIEETEIEAWQKIIRVLTHEIMNSITPISSLACTINELLQESVVSCLPTTENNKEVMEDVSQALQTIQKRSQGLMHFVDAYRNYTLTPEPKFKHFVLTDLFQGVKKLLQANIKNKKIDFKVKIEPEDLKLTADPELIEQVLINLLLNALQSVEKQNDARIELLAQLDGQGKILVHIKDNGPGIKKENLDKIFIPFFSTKEGGSGIGLSFSRQIMRLHNGTLTAHSLPDEMTTFTLRF